MSKASELLNLLESDGENLVKISNQNTEKFKKDLESSKQLTGLEASVKDLRSLDAKPYVEVLMDIPPSVLEKSEKEIIKVLKSLGKKYDMTFLSLRNFKKDKIDSFGDQKFKPEGTFASSANMAAFRDEVLAKGK